MRSLEQNIKYAKDLLLYISKGPWKSDAGNMEVEIEDSRIVIADFYLKHGEDCYSNMEFIALSRELIPQLIEELERGGHEST